MEERPRKRRRILIDEHKNDEGVRSRAAKRVKREKTKTESGIKSEPSIKKEAIVARESTEEENIDSSASDSIEGRLHDIHAIQDSWRIKVVQKWSEDSIDKMLVDMPQNIREWLAAQPFYDPRETEPTVINWQKYYNDRESSGAQTRPYKGYNGIDKVNLEEVYKYIRGTFIDVPTTHCYSKGSHANIPEFLEVGSFGKGFAGTNLSDLHPYYKDSTSTQEISPEQVSKFLNIATKFIFMNGRSSVPSHPRLEFLGVSKLQRQLERVVEWALQGFEPAISEFGRSTELPHLLNPSDYSYIPTSLSQFTTVLDDNPNANDKRLFEYSSDEVKGGSSVTPFTAYHFNYDRFKLLLSRKSCLCRLKIIAHSFKLLGEKFHRFAQRSLDIALAYLRLTGKVTGNYECHMNLAMDLFLASKFPPNSPVEVHYMSILARSSFSTLPDSFKLWFLKHNRLAADLTLVFDNLLDANDRKFYIWLIRWAIHNNPRCLRRAVDSFSFPMGKNWQVAARHIEQSGLYQSQIVAYAYLGYFFGCSVFKVQKGPVWFGKRHRIPYIVNIMLVTMLRSFCLCVLPKLASEEEHVVTRFIALASVYLADRSFGDLCLFNAPYYDNTGLNQVLRSGTFTTTKKELDLIVKTWPNLFDLNYKYSLPDYTEVTFLDEPKIFPRYSK